MSTSTQRPGSLTQRSHSMTFRETQPRPRFNLFDFLLRGLAHGSDVELAAPTRMVGGTAPAHVVARRRAANKAARVSRRINRRSAR